MSYWSQAQTHFFFVAVVSERERTAAGMTIHFTSFVPGENLSSYIKKEVYKREKLGQVTQVEYRVTVSPYRDGIRKAKAHKNLKGIQEG